MEDVHSWGQPPCIAALRLVELLKLLLKHEEDAASRIAVFELVSERVCEKILLRAFFVHFQGIIKNYSKVGGCGSRVNVRHKGEVKN
jgi:hypothetical protein